MMTALNCFGQDQTVILNGFRTIAELPEKSTGSIDFSALADRSKRMAEASRIITAALGENPDAAAYYILHVVKLGDQTGSVEENDWYIYYKGWADMLGLQEFQRWLKDPRNAQHFTEARIFGSKKIKLVYAYDNLKGFQTDTLPKTHTETLSFWESKVPKPSLGEKTLLGTSMPDFWKGKQDEAEKKATAAGSTAPADVATLVTQRFLTGQSTQELDVAVISANGNSISCSPQMLGIFKEKGKPEYIRKQGIFCADQTYTPYLGVTYETKIVKKTPAPRKDLADILTLLGTAQGGGLENIRIGTNSFTAYGGGDLGVRFETSDITILATVRADINADPKQVATLKVDNERKYHWGINFAVPLTSLDELRYDQPTSSPALFLPKTVERQHIFAAVSVYPFAIDTKNSFFRLTPGFMAGLAIQGKALNQQLYAVSLGIWKLEAFWGQKVSRVQQPEDPTAPANAKPKFDISSRSTFGLSVSVRTVLDLFKSEKAASTTEAAK